MRGASPAALRHVLGAVCLECGEQSDLRGSDGTCGCGGNRDLVYDYRRMRRHLSRKKLSASRDFSVERYRPLLPLAPGGPRLPLHIGWTPLIRSWRFQKAVGHGRVWLKDDTRLPSASFKDRATHVTLLRAMERNEKRVVGASTGNAGASLACLSASVGMPAAIFVPHTAPRGKVAQLRMYGAKVIMVRGNYDAAFDLCRRAAGAFGWYSRSTGANPFTREGKKTSAYEICEQNDWEAPDVVIVPTGDGNIISGLWKGFCDLAALGWVEGRPRMIAAQSVESNAVARAVRAARAGKGSRLAVPVVKATTFADSISVDSPRDGVGAVKSVLDSGGAAVEVTDDEIGRAMAVIASSAGMFCEPAAAAGVASLIKAVRTGLIHTGDQVVVLLTGNGLKDVDAALRVAGTPKPVRPDLGVVKRAVEGR